MAPADSRTGLRVSQSKSGGDAGNGANSMGSPELFLSRADLDGRLGEWRAGGARIGLVPTMGALHDGHLRLVDAARLGSDRLVVSVFVNPSQFGPNEDLARYPRELDRDLERLAGRGVDAVFAPGEAEIYPRGFGTFVEPPPIASRLEGEIRPGHFRGVATVVVKLIHLCRADRAWFGQKDFQQLAVVRRVVADLDIPCEILMEPTVRDGDGLALSSRNRYLSGDERERALSLVRALRQAAALIADGERDGHVVMAGMNQALIDGGVSSVDYAVVADPGTLETMHEIRLPAVLLVAARVGTTRLIDNWMVG